MITPSQKLILNELRNNSRIPLTRISRKHDIPIYSVISDYYDLINYFDLNFVTMVNYLKCGFKKEIVFIIKNSGNPFLNNFLQKRIEVNNFYKLEDDFFYIHAIFRDEDELSLFVVELLDLDVIIDQELEIKQTLRLEDFQICD